MDSIEQFLKEKNILSHQNQEIILARVSNSHEGLLLAKEVLYQVVTSQTVLYLSGGSTPKVLYEQLAKDEKIKPGAVGMIDERFGPPFHEKSNEKMIKETGLLRYLQMRDIPWYPILKGHNREETAHKYDEKLRQLHASYPKSVAIVGVGSDGHTAGIPAFNETLKDQIATIYETYDLVTHYHDTSGVYGERVTMTFVGLSMLDTLIVLAFGEEKKKALELLFTDGSEQEIPARFFKRPEITKKTLFITDQTI